MQGSNPYSTEQNAPQSVDSLGLLKSLLNGVALSRLVNLVLISFSAGGVNALVSILLNLF